MLFGVVRRDPPVACNPGDIRRSPIGTRQSSGPRMCSSLGLENIPIYPRVLVLDVGPPGWSAVRSVLCEALSNVLCLGAATAQPGERISVYTVRERHHCLLPLLEMKGNLCRLLRCLSELQALPTEGSGPVKNSAISMAVLDSLQQNKQRMQLSSSGATARGCFVEVTVVSPRSGRDLMCDLDGGMKDADLGTLRRLLVLQISCEQEQNGSPKTPLGQGSNVYDIDLHLIPPNVLCLEMFLKSWLLERNGEKEKCHLIFPEGASELEVMCDVSLPLLNPGLLHGERGETYLRGSDMTGATQSWKVIRAVSSSGVCGSMLYGLPAILTPTACWELDWDQLEANQDNFHALCHCLQSQQLSIVAVCTQHRSSSAPPVRSHVLVSSSGSAALLLRPLAVRELVLLMKVPPLPPTMADGALHRVQYGLFSVFTDELAGADAPTYFDDFIHHRKFGPRQEFHQVAMVGVDEVPEEASQDLIDTLNLAMDSDTRPDHTRSGQRHEARSHPQRTATRGQITSAADSDTRPEHTGSGQRYEARSHRQRTARRGQITPAADSETRPDHTHSGQRHEARSHPQRTATRGQITPAADSDTRPDHIRSGQRHEVSLHPQMTATQGQFTPAADSETRPGHLQRTTRGQVTCSGQQPKPVHPQRKRTTTRGQFTLAADSDTRPVHTRSGQRHEARSPAADSDTRPVHTRSGQRHEASLHSQMTATRGQVTPTADSDTRPDHIRSRQRHEARSHPQRTATQGKITPAADSDTRPDHTRSGQ
ncbi:meiosis 1 arrest protein [Phyllobates terribilis]|uniref:meiosis 1 arrest protein n=1 Tax=Phyllobates terribilis TaxID=111132 RepID=UPI003CCB42AD